MKACESEWSGEMKPAAKTKLEFALVMVMPVLLTVAGRRPWAVGDAILDVDGGDVEVVAGLEGDGDGGGAVVRAGGAHVAHALDAVDGLLEDDGDGGLDVLGVGTDVVAADDDLRRSELGVERDGQGRDADRAGEHDEQRADRSEDRAANEEVYEQGLTSNRRGWPGGGAKDCAEPGRPAPQATVAGAVGLAERLDRSTFLQELQAGEDDLVAGLETAEDGVVVADGFAEGDGTWWATYPSPLGAATKTKVWPPMRDDGENGDGGRGSGAPGDAGLDELLVAEALGGVRDLGLGEDALQAVVDLRREEADGGLARGTSPAVSRISTGRPVRTWPARSVGT